MTRFTDSDQQEIEALQQSIANRMHRSCVTCHGKCATREACGLPTDPDAKKVMTTADKVSRIAWAVLMWVIAGIAAACFFFASVGMP